MSKTNRRGVIMERFFVLLMVFFLFFILESFVVTAYSKGPDYFVSCFYAVISGAYLYSERISKEPIRADVKAFFYFFIYWILGINMMHLLKEYNPEAVWIAVCYLVVITPIIWLQTWRFVKLAGHRIAVKWGIVLLGLLGTVGSLTTLAVGIGKPF